MNAKSKRRAARTPLRSVFTTLVVAALTVLYAADSVTFGTETIAQYQYDAAGNRVKVTVGVTTPTNLTATAVAGNQINLSWTGASGLTGYSIVYAIYRCVNAVCGNYTQFSTSGTTYQDTSVSPATTYVYWVTASVSANSMTETSSNSATATATTPNVGPSVPTGLQASAASWSTVNLSWQASTDSIGVSGYKVYRGGSQIGSVANPGTSYTDSTTSPSTSYSYTVSAYDSAGNNSGQSAPASVTTPAPPPPSAPGQPSASAITFTTATVSWGASTDSFATPQYEYRIYPTSQGAPSTWTSVGTATSVGVSGLSGGVPYEFDVRAYDSSGNRSASSATTFTAASPITVSFTSGDTANGVGGVWNVGAYYYLYPNGGISESCSGCEWNGVVGSGNWLASGAVASNYQVLASNGCGSYGSGTFGTWQSLASAVGWGVSLPNTAPEAQDANCSITLSIRATASPSTIIATTSIYFSVWTGD